MLKLSIREVINSKYYIYFRKTKGGIIVADYETIKKELQLQAKDGKISCAECHKLAEELGVPLKKVGQAADELKIKIKACQLGCFE